MINVRSEILYPMDIINDTIHTTLYHNIDVKLLSLNITITLFYI